MKLSKEQFVKYVNIYEKMLNQEQEIWEAFGIAPEWVCGDWISYYYGLLAEMCELKEDRVMGTWLDWFCYETDFGKDNTVNCVYDKDTGEICERITNAEKLYDLIVSDELT